MSVIQTKNIDYTEKISQHSNPLFLKVQPINNVQSFAPSITSVFGPVEILIPARTIALNRSKISFDLLVPAQAASTYAWLQANALTLFDRITLTSQASNAVLCDIPNANRYASMLSPIMTTQEELNSKSSPYSSIGIHTAAGTAISAITVVPIMNTTLALAQRYQGEDISRSNAGANPDGNANDTVGFANSIRKLLVSSSTATDNYVSFNFDLSSFHSTIFDVDKLLYFGGEQLLLSLYFSPVNRYCWGGTSNTNPATGFTVATGSFSITNLTMYLCVEQNIEISSALVERVNTKGLTIPFPYPFINRSSLAAPNISISQQLTRGFGHRLLYVASSIFASLETNNSAQDHSIQSLLLAPSAATAANYPAFSVLNYNTFIDNIAVLTNSNISIIGGGQNNSEFFTMNRAHLKGCAIQNITGYALDFCHIDNFCTDSLCQADLTLIDGLDLSSTHIYSWNCTGSSSNTPNLNVYLIFVCQKMLHLNSAGVSVM